MVFYIMSCKITHDYCLKLTDGAFCIRHPEFEGSRQIPVKSKTRTEFDFVWLKYKKNDMVCQWDNYKVPLLVCCNSI